MKTTATATVSSFENLEQVRVEYGHWTAVALRMPGDSVRRWSLWFKGGRCYQHITLDQLDGTAGYGYLALHQGRALAKELAQF
jgi:hypothetical protein